MITEQLINSENDQYHKSASEELSNFEKHKKKTLKQESKDNLAKDVKKELSDFEFPPVTGVTFPSVKGAEG